MATAVLVEGLIEDGERLVRHLDQSSFQVHSAFWYYDDDADRWLLYLATPLFDREGPTRVYAELQRVLERISPRVRISLSSMSVISPHHDLVRLLRRAISTGPGISGIRFSRNTVDGVFIPDCYVYRIQ